MLENDVVSVSKNLIDGNYDKVLDSLRDIGRPIKKEWKIKLLRETGKTPKKYKFTSDTDFKVFLTNRIEIYIGPAHPQTTIQDDPQQIQLFKEKLSRLAIFLTVWKYIENNKKLRQQIKPKSPLDKNDRYAINIALQSMAFTLCQQSNHFVKYENLIEEFKKLNSKNALLDFISDHIKRLNKLETVKVTNYELPNIQKEIEKIAKAISAFQTPNKKKKLLKYFGISLAFIAALACGLSTGLEIFLLISNFPVAIAVAVLILAFGFYANFNFFSVNFPDFLLSLVKKGGLTEYIDFEGKRQQFSTTYKCLLAPVILASITVGAGTTALTYITILSVVAKIIPALLILYPPLALIILGILAISVGITLTVAVLTASLTSLKKVAALNMTFTELCKYTYKNCIEWCKIFKNLKPHQKIGYIITFSLLPIALFGLVYFRYTAGIDLAEFIDIIGAAVMGVIAYIAQTAFTVISVNKLSNVLIKPFSSSTTQKDASISTPNSFFTQVKSYFLYPLCLVGNAFGNALLVYNGSPISVFGAIACFFNSLAGNLSEPDVNQSIRELNNNLLTKEVENFYISANTQYSASTITLPPRPNLISAETSYPKESASPPSPTKSIGNELYTNTYDKSSSRLYTSIPENESPVNKQKKQEQLAPAARH